MESLTESMPLLSQECSLIEGFEPNGSEKHFYIRGKFATIEAKNNNGRIYPRHLWEREVAKYQNEIKNGTKNTLMEWDHPKDRLDVNPLEAIAKITKLWIEGNYVMGEAIIFDVPKAEVLKSFIKYGVQMSVSSRARGRCNAQGIVEEFNLITFDFVANPSDNAATMYGIFEHLIENKGDEMDDNLIESMVGMIRAKDIEIQDLKDEVEIWKLKLNESTASTTDNVDDEMLKEYEEKIEDMNKEIIGLKESIDKLCQKLNEASIGVPTLDNQHITIADFETNKDIENNDYFMRAASQVLSQTHRHQDVALLKDSDPASSAFSGEDEVTRIANLLRRTFGRVEDVGTVLNKDVDTGTGLPGVAARVEDVVRPAEVGLDNVQRRNLGLTESKSFIV